MWEDDDPLVPPVALEKMKIKSIDAMLVDCTAEDIQNMFFDEARC